MASLTKLYLIGAALIFFYFKIFFNIFYKGQSSKMKQLQIVEGLIDTNCITAEQLISINSNINQTLNKLRKTSFFKIFKVRLDSDCPFWAQNFNCLTNKCATQWCQNDQVPSPWQEYDQASTQKNKPKPQSAKFQACPFMNSKTQPVNSNIMQNYKSWNSYNKTHDSWFIDEQFDQKSTYVNLQKNLQSYTGFNGIDIWKIIYQQNCLRSDQKQAICKEQNLLYKVISGVHASINTHLAKFYYDYGDGKYLHNQELFYQRVGKHKDRMQNMYFTYSLMLRALNRMYDFYINYQIQTGNKEEDVEAKYLLVDLLKNSFGKCEVPFQEKKFFQDQDTLYLRNQMKSYFFNITRIFDCISCERCKLHGKLQITGIGAALKVLFNQNKVEPYLNRNEIIAFFNTLGKFSTSLRTVEQMKSHHIYLSQQKDQMRYLLAIILGLSFVVSMLILRYCIRKQKAKDEKLQEQGIRVRQEGDIMTEQQLQEAQKMTQQQVGEFLDKKFPDLLKED